LWTLIEMMKWLKKEKLRTRVVGQIHDSIIYALPGDVQEARYVFEKQQQLLSKELPAAWPWVIVPLSAEFKLSSKINGSWAELKDFKI
jgi:DNA polymerase I-like protein with 3'-5' exonuclease and polymerase domains